MSDPSNSVPWSVIDAFFDCSCDDGSTCEHASDLGDSITEAASAALNRYRQRLASEAGDQS